MQPFPVSLPALAVLLTLASGAADAQSHARLEGLGLPALQQAPAPLVALGRSLFLDPRLSQDGSMSCATCHVPEQGFAFNGPKAIGAGGRPLRRNAPSVLNAGFNTLFFHDGRAPTLEEQAWGPLLASDEMANADRASVVQRVRAVPQHRHAFDQVFPGQGVSAESLAAALAAYQRSLVSGGSRFDRWYFGGEESALTPEEKRGFVVYRGKAQCNACHALGRAHALFHDDQFHNLGVGFPAPGQEPAPDAGVQRDLGRFETTGKASDRFAFRTPTLRNIELTAPYMHDGSLATLEEVVDFYDRGGNPNPGLDPLMSPLFLSQRDKQDLAAFMRTLTGANVHELAAQARAAAPAP
jgi:cytochrome c peroxidase